jgi:hypothetical protein
MNEKKIRIAFRAPRLPTIIISKDRLYAGISRKSLEKFLKVSIPQNGEEEIILIDSEVEEFWYMSKEMILSPGITIYNKWTKKNITNLFNKSSNAKELGIEYPQKSLQNKKVTTIIMEICALINKSNAV